MKTLIYILMALIGILVIINAFKLDFSNIFEGESAVAVISILSGFCAFLLLSILMVSQKIKSKLNK